MPLSCAAAYLNDVASSAAQGTYYVLMLARRLNILLDCTLCDVFSLFTHRQQARFFCQALDMLCKSVS